MAKPFLHEIMIRYDRDGCDAMLSWLREHQEFIEIIFAMKGWKLPSLSDFLD